MRALTRALAVVPLALAPLAVTTGGVATAADDPATTYSSVTMFSEGDYIGQGIDRIWRDGAGTVAVDRMWGDALRVSVDGGSSGDSFDLVFDAPTGESLSEGVYLKAERAAFHSPDRPGIDVFGDGRGCNTVAGEFTVLDLAPDLSRVWIVYESRCEGGSAAVFGEIKVNVPSDGELDLLSTDVRWPVEHPGVTGRTVPVTVVNPSLSPVTVSGASVTEGAADFTVHGNTCTTLEAGETCTVYVGYQPQAPGHREGRLTITDSTAAGSREVSLAGTAYDGQTSWDMSSEAGDWVGGGRDWSYSDQQVSASGTESRVGFSVKAGGTWWDARFEAGASGALLPGTYTGATDSRGDAPLLDVSGDGRGCSTEGSFTVHEAVYREGRLHRFRVTFEQECENSDATLTGDLRWRAGATDNAGPSAVGDVTVTPRPGAAAIAWTDPADVDWTHTDVRQVSGSQPPVLVTAGARIASGRAGRVDATGLTSGRDYSFSIVPFDVDDFPGARRFLTLLGTRLTSGVSDASLVDGQASVVRGRLVEATSGDGAGRQPVEVLARTRGTTAWRSVGTATTDGDGDYALTVRPRATTDYRVSFAGRADLLASTSTQRSVAVAPKVTLAASRTSVRAGSVVGLTTTVSPSHGGWSVALQRWAGGRWQPVTSKRLDGASRAVFSVRPGRGTHSYRVVKVADPNHSLGLSRTVRVVVR